MTISGSECKLATVEDGKSSCKMSIEDALTATGFGLFNYVIIFNAGLILTGILLETLILSFVLPVAQCDLNVNTSDKGILNGVAFIGIIVSTHLWGLLTDIFGRRTIIYRALFLSFACTLLSSIATNFWFLLVFRFLSGFFVSGAGVAVYPYLSEFHNLENSTRAIVRSSIVFGVGCLTLPGLAWIILYFDYEFVIPLIGIAFKPWRLLIIAGGGPSLWSGLLTFWYPESPKFLLFNKKEKEAIDVVTQMFRRNNGPENGILQITSLFNAVTISLKSTSEYNMKSPLSIIYVMWDHTATIFSRNYVRVTLIAMAMQFGVYMMSTGFSTWLPDILNRYADYQNKNPNHHITICDMLNATGFGLETVLDSNSTIVKCYNKIDSSAFELSFLLEVYYLVGYIVLGALVGSLGKLPLIIMITTISGVSSLALAFVTVPVVSTHLLLIMSACGMVDTLINAATVELYPTELRATGLCLALLAGRIGCIFVANLSGFLLQFSCQVSFIFAGIALIFCGLIGFFIPNIYKIVGKKIIFT